MEGDSHADRRELIVRRDGNWTVARTRSRMLDIPDAERRAGARIDRLSDEARHVLQIASVIGRQFHQGAKTCLTEEGLA